MSKIVTTKVVLGLPDETEEINGKNIRKLLRRVKEAEMMKLTGLKWTKTK